MTTISRMTVAAAALSALMLGCTSSPSTTEEPTHRDSFYLEMTVPAYAGEYERNYYVHVDASRYRDETIRAEVGVGDTIDELAIKRYAIELKPSRGVLDDFVIEDVVASARFKVLQSAEAQTYDLHIAGADHAFDGVQALLSESWQAVPPAQWDELAMMLGLTGVARRIDHRFASGAAGLDEGAVSRLETEVAEEGEACCAIEVAPSEDAAFPWPGVVWAGVKIGAGCVALGCLAYETFTGSRCNGTTCETVFCPNPGNCPNHCPNGDGDCRPR